METLPVSRRPRLFSRRAQLLCVFILALAAADCGIILPQSLGSIPKISIDLFDDRGQPLDSVQVFVSRHGPSTTAYVGGLCGEPGNPVPVPGKIDSDLPRTVDKHFDYQCPWGSEWVQIEFRKPGYLPASRDFTISTDPAVPVRVVLHTPPSTPN